jgi:acetylornithine deacetylase/succinyl-diaminopimelate desuccinylase-like protein
MGPAAAEEFYERTMANTAIDVHGIAVGEPYLQKTVLPVSAEANVSIRLAAGQNRDQIDEAFQRLVREALPEGADLEIERWGAAPPGLIPPDSAAIVLAQDAFERVVGRRPLLLRSGGTLPIVPALAAKRIPTILSGFALPNANMHSPNECLLARYVPLGVATARETLMAFKDL